MTGRRPVTDIATVAIAATLTRSGRSIDLTVTDRRGRGRPSTGTAIQVRIPADTLAHVDHLAQTAGTTRAAWIRAAVTQAVAACRDVPRRSVDTTSHDDYHASHDDTPTAHRRASR